MNVLSSTALSGLNAAQTRLGAAANNIANRLPITRRMPTLQVTARISALGMLATTGVIGTAGASMFPFIMPSSTMPNASLTVWDSVSSHLTLGIMFWATIIFMPLIVMYTSWAYSVMRGKVTEAYIRENDHAAY